MAKMGKQTGLDLEVLSYSHLSRKFVTNHNNTAAVKNFSFYDVSEDLWVDGSNNGQHIWKRNTCR